MDSFGQTNPVEGINKIITRITEVGEKYRVIHRKHIELLPDILQNPILYQIIHKTLKLLKMYFELQIRFNKKVRDKASNYSIINFYFDMVDMINQMYLKKIIFIYEIVESGQPERYQELPPYLLNDIDVDQPSRTLFDNVKNFLTGLALNNIDFLEEQIDKLKKMAKKKLSKLKDKNIADVETEIKENIEIVADKLEEKIDELNQKIEDIDIEKRLDDNLSEEKHDLENKETNLSKKDDLLIKEKDNKLNQSGGDIKFNKIYDPVYNKWINIKSVRGINLLNIFYKNGYIF
jgi:hypothetical protein